MSSRPYSSASHTLQDGIANHRIAIFVGGLPPEASDSGLYQYFQRFGNIICCKTKRWDTDASKCKGYAVLEVADWPTYQRITAAPHFWLGRHIECKRAILKKKALLRYNKRVMSLKVFVTGLPLQTTDDDLHEYFGRFGPIEMAYVVTKYVRKTRIGYVCFRRRADKTAVLEHEGHRMRGQKIFVLDYLSKDLMKGNSDCKKEKLSAWNQTLETFATENCLECPNCRLEKVRTPSLEWQNTCTTSMLDAFNNSDGVAKQSKTFESVDPNLRFNICPRPLYN